jgi:uncharacterized membrane protein
MPGLHKICVWNGLQTYHLNNMKLLTKYSRINLVSSVVIFLLASIAFYILLRFVLIDQVDEDLKIEEHEIEM